MTLTGVYSYQLDDVPLEFRSYRGADGPLVDVAEATVNVNGQPTVYGVLRVPGADETTDFTFVATESAVVEVVCRLPPSPPPPA